jgi:hypothetical protein
MMAACVYARAERLAIKIYSTSDGHAGARDASTAIRHIGVLPVDAFTAGPVFNSLSHVRTSGPSLRLICVFVYALTTVKVHASLRIFLRLLLLVLSFRVALFRCCPGLLLMLLALMEILAFLLSVLHLTKIKRQFKVAARIDR